MHETPSISQEPTDLRHGEFEKGAQAAWLVRINRNDLSEAQLRETKSTFRVCGTYFVLGNLPHYLKGHMLIWPISKYGL